MEVRSKSNMVKRVNCLNVNQLVPDTIASCQVNYCFILPPQPKHRTMDHENFYCIWLIDLLVVGHVLAVVLLLCVLECEPHVLITD